MSQWRRASRSPWSTTENVTWKLALPELSGSTPIIWNDRIFLNIGDGPELYLLCVDRQKGVELWKKHLGSGNARVNKQNMSSPSPSPTASACG